MNIFKWTVCTFLVTALSACGGGGSQSETNISGNDGGGDQSIDYSPVAGLYNTTHSFNGGDDENYLYISAQGEITAYNYLGDSINGGDNCYREAEGDDINSQINGESLSFDSANREYYFMLDSQRAFWRIDVAGEITHVGLGMLASVNTVTSFSPQRRIKLTKVKAEGITHQDILDALCEE